MTSGYSIDLHGRIVICRDLNDRQKLFDADRILRTASNCGFDGPSINALIETCRNYDLSAMADYLKPYGDSCTA